MKSAYLYLLIVFMATRCAQITPLTGGKRDTTAPKVLNATPAFASLNFNSKEIVLQFDEYINLKDITNQFIITPQTKELPDIQAKGKIVKVTFNETLLPNTTYKLSFGNAIVDLHESNALPNFEYVFSTGSVIDSLKLSGSIVSATTKKPEKNILVGLYDSKSEDSVIYKQKPLYISRTNQNGEYKFTYLPQTPFKLVAIDDSNKNLMYDGSDEQIAFTSTSVTATDSTATNLLLFKEQPSKLFIKKTISAEYGKAIVIYNKACKDITTVTWSNMQGAYHINDLQDTVTIYYENAFDTLQTIIHRYTHNDTLTLKTPSKTDYEKLKKNNKLKYVLNTNLTSSFPYYDTPSIQLNLPYSLDNIQKDKISFFKFKDSLKAKQVFEILENEKRIHSYFIKTPIEKETSYQLIIDKGAFIDSAGRTNDSLNFKFKTTSPDDYAQLNLKLLFPHKENYIVLLLNDKDQIIEKRFVAFSLASTNEKTLSYINIAPGLYTIKVVEDANKNNTFDAGDFFKHSQPETIFINTTPIKLLAGWEIENEWIVK